MFINILFIFIATILGTLIGSFISLFSFKFPKEISKILQNFSLGGMIGLVFFDLIIESIENFSDFNENKFVNIIIPVSIIFLISSLFFFIHELLHKYSHHHNEDNDDKEECHDHLHSDELKNNSHSLFISTLIFFIAISIHNIPEGLSLGFTFINNSKSSYAGIIMSIILFLHNLLISYSMTLSFLNSNKSKKISFLYSFISSLPAFIFGLIGYFIVSIDLPSYISGIILSISSGSLLYVLFIELLPQTFNTYKSKFTFIYILLGMLTTALLILI